MKNFSKRQSYQWGYRGPTIQRKKYNLEKPFFSLNLVFAKKIRLVSMTHQGGYIQTKDEKYNFWKKKTFLLSVFKKKFLTLFWVGVQNSEDRKENFSCAELSFHRKLFSLKKTFEKFVIKDQWGTKNDKSNWNLYFENNFCGKILWWESFFKGRCCQWEYRGPTIEKKIILWRIYFFHWLLFPSNKIDSFGIIHPWGKQNWCYKQKYKFRKLFLRKLCFSLNDFEWHSYKWGLLMTDDREENFYFWKLFHRKSFQISFFWLVWYDFSMGIHTNDDGNQNYV